jgi:hypothetical protein
MRLLVPYRESVELVVNLPDVPELHISSLNRFVDQAYLYTYDGGKWVARIDHREYYELTPQLRDMMLQIGRMRELPPVPTTLWTCYLSTPAIMILISPFGIFGALVTKLIAPFVKPLGDKSTAHTRKTIFCRVSLLHVLCNCSFFNSCNDAFSDGVSANVAVI